MLGDIPRRKLFSLPLLIGGLLVCKDIAKAETRKMDEEEILVGCAICQIVDHKNKFIIRNGKAYHKHCLDNPPKWFNHHYANRT